MKMDLNNPYFRMCSVEFVMIVNVDKIKTEALLLFCRDLIYSYKDAEIVFDFDSNFIGTINKSTEDFLKEIEKVVRPIEFYIQNKNHFKIKAILSSYTFLNQTISKYFSQNDQFNPSLLYLSLLTNWFSELDKEKNSKEYIFFNLFPFSELYDELLFKIKDNNYKILNLKMIEVSEKIILEFNRYIIKF